MKSIIFNTEMVKAISDGRKTQFREALNPQPEKSYDGMYCDMYNKNPDKWTFWTKDNKMCLFKGNIKNTAHWKPKYKVGDILYVKETFCIDNPPKIDGIDYRNYLDNIVFKADNEDLNFKWKPSVHLKQKDARIFLKIIGVRVERLQDVSCDDILDEGYNELTSGVLNYEWFSELWNSTLKYHNGIKKSQNDLNKYSWEDNPYVFVYEFEIVRNK
jgi:hypothetical protein